VIKDAGRDPSGQALPASPPEPQSVSALSGNDPSRGFDDAVVVFASAARLLWDAVQKESHCDQAECVFRDENCHCVETYSALAAQAIDARSGETEGLDPEGESAVAEPCAQGDPA
jgi:hypothetical protein